MPNPFARAAAATVAHARRADGFAPTAGSAGSPYAGALPLTSLDWLYGSISANQAVRQVLPVLRDRANDLVANNSAAAPVPRIFSENVIGKDGITFTAAVPNSRGGFNDTVNDRLEDAWYRWCEPQFASVERKWSWYDIETHLAEREPVDGEVLMRLVPGFGNAFNFAVEVLDPAQLDHQLNREAAPGQNAIVMGVEVDSWGAPVAYHLHPNHPSETRRAGRRSVHLVVPAEQIIHLFVLLRPKQQRGLSWFAPVIIDLNMLGGYRVAELTAARAGAIKWATLEVDPEKAEFLQGKSPGMPARIAAQPGMVQQLPAGMRLVQHDPQHPNSAFEPFDKAITRSIATALRLSYMSLSGDLSDTSYGSGRIGLLAERAVYQRLQQRIAQHVHQRVYRAWLREALLTDELPLGSFDPRRFDRVVWHPRTFPWIDPEKDIKAAAMEIALGGSSHTRFAAAGGRDLGELLEEKARELQAAADAGVSLVLPIGTGAIRADGTPLTTTTAGDEGNGGRGREIAPPRDGREAQAALIRRELSLAAYAARRLSRRRADGAPLIAFTGGLAA